MTRVLHRLLRLPVQKRVLIHTRAGRRMRTGLHTHVDFIRAKRTAVNPLSLMVKRYVYIRIRTGRQTAAIIWQTFAACFPGGCIPRLSQKYSFTWPIKRRSTLILLPYPSIASNKYTGYHLPTLALFLRSHCETSRSAEVNVRTSRIRVCTHMQAAICESLLCLALSVSLVLYLPEGFHMHTHVRNAQPRFLLEGRRSKVVRRTLEVYLQPGSNISHSSAW